MKLLLILCGILWVTTTASSTSIMDFVFKSKNPFKDQFFNASAFIPQQPNPRIIDGAFYTKLDHFRPQDTRKVYFQYKINMDYYQAGGPLLFFIDSYYFGEYFIQNGLMVDIIRNLGGALITFDHRYYGVNIPTETASFEDLQYNTVEQSIADIATLIVTVKRHLASPSPRVGVWGAGEGGTLATWAKRKYPQLIDASWSSSGLLLPLTAGPHYLLQIASNFMYYGGEECYETFEEVFNVFEHHIENHQGEVISEAFGLCDPVDTESPNDIAWNGLLLIEVFSAYINSYQVHGMLQLCNALHTIPGDPFNSFARWFRFHFAVDGCLNTNYRAFIDITSVEEWNQPGTLALRQFYHFVCTQFGYFAITQPDMLFPDYLTVDLYITLCTELFGSEYSYPKLQQANDHLKVIYGDYLVPTNEYLFTNGEMDGWFTRGITNIFHPIQTNAYIINIPYAYHGSDLTSINQWEPAPLTQAKLRIVEIITNWIYGI